MKIKISQKAFTLIELMIVIAIIWVLAVTLVPQLTWAQARARDAWRISSIKNIAAVLETYNSDEGLFPSPSDSVGSTNSWCLSTSSWAVIDDLANLFKWWKAPLDPQVNNISWNCWVPWVFSYNALTKNGLSKGWYILITNVETDKKANLDIKSFNYSSDYTTMSSDDWWWATEFEQSNYSVYAEMN